MTDIDFLKRQAKRKGMTEREFCIYKIQEWRENLEIVSKDYMALSEELYQKKLDKEILDRNSE